MIFATLPETFSKLEALVRAMDVTTVSTPPPFEAIGRRLRRSYANARSDAYRSLSIGEIRKLPYAFWLPPEQPLPELDELLVKRYWAEALPNAVSNGPRRAKRWLTPLFFTYCEAFDPTDDGFHSYARRLVAALARAEGNLADRLKTLQRAVAFFSPDRAPARLANALLAHQGRLEAALEDHLLWPTFLDTNLGNAVFSAALELSDKERSEESVVVRLLDWSKRLSAPISKTQHRAKFADALLSPWVEKSPPENIKAALTRHFVEVYGDPRIVGHRQYHWQDVSSQALGVLMRWLAGDTLRGFMRILERTADDIWRFRQKFWMTYYDAGYIQEAWLALGYQAARYARQMQGDERGMGFGRLESGATPNQSVLLLRIGDLVFTEWSHNGSLRAYRDDVKGVPTLYKESYHGAEFRAAQSMDFHDGVNQNPELRHMNSQGGTWQRKARDFIRQHTNIHFEDREIL